ncbi:MAG: anthranilate synthase component I [bacterium]|nr:anthranilate synthase component I [bacterium]
MGKKIKLIPVIKEISGDLDTPVSVYLKLNQKNSFLLESVTGGEQVARYSFIGLDPFCALYSDNGENKVMIDGEEYENCDNAVDELEKLVNKYTVEEVPELPFAGGAVGYFSWEIISSIEKIKLNNKKESLFPLAHFIFPGSLVIFDHVTRKIIILILAKEDELAEADIRLNKIEEKLQSCITCKPLDLKKSCKSDIFSKVISNYKKEEYFRDVEKVKKHIFEGDVFQLVLSQKFSMESDKDPFDVYRTLRYINPSPYMYYFNFEDYSIIGSSPEILVRLKDNKAMLRPIAGTRPRIKDQEEELIRELCSDEKERAEHIMLVDLGRNDLGRVCKYGTVETNDLMVVEKYSHVMHMVSNVEGEILQNKNAFDLFKAAFPAGTLSGTPKVRAMEIIEDLEPEQRGPYGGALGYFDFRGNMDLCIIIRTILARQNQFFIQAGGGIVADSVPESEYQETKNKAKGMIEACLL